ncbi:hypothetical protein [uncultured Megamonas sp.]|uniref:hypothetical protein n=1 Tax=uncultured Megamonas sp. TaxID=286140 RepID=UPI0025936503|nr:hypothetical protein [uncultured Megamonas sp.]
MAVKKITKAISKEVEDKNIEEQQSTSEVKEQVDEKIKSVGKLEELQKSVEDLCGKILDFSIERMDKFKNNPGYQLTEDERETINTFMNVAERMDNLLNKKTGLNFADKLLNKI